MYEFFYNVLQPSLKDLMLHYMDTDSFVLSFTEGSIDNKYMDLSNLEVPIKTNNKVPGKFKHELGSKEIEEFIVLKPKTYSFKHFCAKEKGIKKENNGKHEDYYNALMDDKERIVDQCRIQKVGDKMTTIKTSKRSLNNFDDKRFYVNNITSYPLDENLYLFKRDLIKMIREQAPLVVNQSGSPIKLNLELDKDKDLLINNIQDLTINDDRNLIEAAIVLYNELYK